MLLFYFTIHYFKLQPTDSPIKDIIFIEPLYCSWVLSLIHTMLRGKEKTVHPVKSSIRSFFKGHLICCKGFWLGLYLVERGGRGLGVEEIRLVICKNSDWWSVFSGVSKGSLKDTDRVFLPHLSTICQELSHLSMLKMQSDIYYKKWYTCAKLKHQIYHWLMRSRPPRNNDTVLLNHLHWFTTM